jgi:hypothetical protein
MKDMEEPSNHYLILGAFSGAADPIEELLI